MKIEHEVTATFDWDYIEHDVFDILSKNHPGFQGDINWAWVFDQLNRHANAPNYSFFDIEKIRKHLEVLIGILVRPQDPEVEFYDEKGRK